jgi:hypothetical protein
MPAATTSKKTGSDDGFPLVQKLQATAFFSVFLLLGLVIGYVSLAWPAYHIIAASSWAPTTCMIGSSRLQETKSFWFNNFRRTLRNPYRDDPPTYRVEVRYVYTVTGQTYGGVRYNFSLVSTGGQANKASVVESLRPGATIPCFYDPANPSQSVIDRSPFSDMWFGLMALPFFALGVGGIVITFKDLSTGAKAPQSRPSATTLGPQTTQLSQDQPRLARFLIGLVATLCYTAIAIGLYPHLEAYRASGIPIPNTALLVFGGAGLSLALTTIRQGLSLRNPQTAILVSSPTVAGGDELAINWSVSGRAESLTKLTIDLEGREEIDYKEGNTTTTKRMVFATIPVTSMARGNLSRAGSKKIIIPAGAMTTFDGSFNRIIWTIRVRGAIPRWPDLDDQYPVTIIGKSE